MAQSFRRGKAPGHDADGGGFDFGYDCRVEQVADGRWLEGEAGVALAYLTLEDAAGYTVLKEATDTQNFILISVSDDDVSILEKSVKSVKDWSDEDKIFDREISVPIPAAG